MPLPSANLSFEGVRAMVQPPSFFGAHCSKACSEAARRWTRWQAAQRYRASEKGKERRRQQSCRYRERVRQRRQAAQEPAAACEGHQEAASSEKIPCSRPGCYELFAPERRSPLKKFCCALCRNALRRVRQREARWQQAPSPLPAAERREPFRGPPSRIPLGVEY